MAELPPVTGVAHRRVGLLSVGLHVAEAGDGPPLVLLHGWLQHWWAWRHLIPRMAETYRVIVPDLRGWGWSDAPPGDYAKSTLAADIVELLDAEGLDAVRIVAHDWGGYAAFLVALGQPARVERMVVLDIAPPWRGAFHPRQLALPLVGAYQGLLATFGLGPWTLTSSGRFVRAVIRAASGPGMRWAGDELDVYADVLREPARARASAACYRTFLTRELPAVMAGGDRSGELRVPTLLVMGGGEPAAARARPAAGAVDARGRSAAPGTSCPRRRPSGSSSWPCRSWGDGPGSVGARREMHVWRAEFVERLATS
jgi:pimeloyl-ACP methyl ester carboxylesterase